MDYKNKYEQAIERAKAMIKVAANQDEAIGFTNTIFPELKESEDDRIRKALIEMVHDTTGDALWVDYNVHKEECIAWLEKQGEQKSFAKYKVGDTIYYDSFGRLVSFVIANIVEDGTDNPMYEDKDGNSVFQNDIVEQKSVDKVEPKFHKGEWITNGDYTWKIVEVKLLDYILQSQDGNIVDDTISHVDEQFHSFTIEDAKDGDVLTNGKMVVIFKYFEEPSYRQHIVAYIGLDRGGDIQITDDIWRLGIDKAKPATKEQRDALMKAMTDAGYTFDFDKKELKKIEQKPAENEELTEFDKAVGVSIGTWNPKTPEQIQSVKAVSKKLLKLAKKQINDEQNPAWSEEDSIRLQRIIDFLWYNRKGDTDTIYQQEQDIDWLKSLRPQNRWKPSEEQMKVLTAISSKKILSEYERGMIVGLYTELQKLT